jgi:hypothetical protein
MFVQPGKSASGTPLIVRAPNRRLLRVAGEEVPENSFWMRRLRDGDVVPGVQRATSAEAAPTPDARGEARS